MIRAHRGTGLRRPDEPDPEPGETGPADAHVLGHLAKGGPYGTVWYCTVL